MEPARPDIKAQPGQPAPRPLAGPILPLVASSVGTDQLLGDPGTRPAAVDALAARTLIKGERAVSRSGCLNCTRCMAAPLSLRKSAIVLKSGIRRPASQTNSTLR
jgi:hypothetical protein